MLPSGFVAAALLLSLIPGWWFLRRTESCRRPRKLSSLQEVLELVGVGVLTTGLAVGVALLIRPQLVLHHSFPPHTPAGIRLDVALVLGALVAATALAELAGWGFRKAYPAKDSELDTGPWWAVLSREKIPEGCLAYVALSVSDGATVEGVLHNYTWSPDAGHRDVALRKPITVTRPGKPRRRAAAAPVVTKTPYDFLVVPGVEIKHIAVKHVPDGKS